LWIEMTETIGGVRGGGAWSGRRKGWNGARGRWSGGAVAGVDDGVVGELEEFGLQESMI